MDDPVDAAAATAPSDVGSEASDADGHQEGTPATQRTPHKATISLPTRGETRVAYTHPLLLGVTFAAGQATPSWPEDVAPGGYGNSLK